MQIRSIQNIVRNNFQYKNNSIKFNPINFKGQDTFEHTSSDDVVVSKRYYSGEQEVDPNLLLQQGDRLLILKNDTYVSYSGHLEEYNANGEVIRHILFKNGAKSIVNTYKNGKQVQEDGCEDTFNNIDKSNKRTSIKKFDGLDESGKRYIQTFEISRNYDKDWENHPAITMKKNIKNVSLIIHFSSPSDDSNGSIEITHHFKGKTAYFKTQIHDEKGYYLNLSPDNSTNETAYLALTELKEAIESEEFRAEFGDNDIFNSELDKAIEYLGSILNVD